MGNEDQNVIGIFTTNTELVVRVWDAVIEGMTGITSVQARDKNIAELIPDLELRGLLTRFKRVLEAGTIEILAPAFHRYLIPSKPQFSSRHFKEMRQRVTIAPLKENEAIQGLIVTIEDVTERMEREIELAEQLKDSDETVRLQAAKALSHDSENLSEVNAKPLIEALSDKSWRVRRELVEGLSRRAAPDAISALLRAMKEQHLDFGLLNSALQVLQATSVNTTETLIEFLQSEDADLRMQAALTLGEQKEFIAVPALLSALTDANENVRFHAIEALAKLQATEAVEPLLQIAKSHNFFLAFSALDALRKIADESITSRILPFLADDLLREAAIETLGSIGNEENVLPLVKLINNNKSFVLPVVKALSNMLERYKTDLVISSKIIQQIQDEIMDDGITNLIYALENGKENDLPDIIGFSGLINNQPIIEKLIDLLEVQKFGDEVALALSRHQQEFTVDLLIEKLKSEDLEVRRAVIKILGSFKNEQVVPSLIGILETDLELNPEAAVSLGKIGDSRAFAPLIELLKTGNSAARSASVEALKLVAHPKTIQHLCPLLSDPNPNIRESAIRIVGYFGAKGCEDALLNCCHDADEKVQRAAIEQLPHIQDKRAVLVLINRLKESSPRIRAVAAQNLARFQPEESLAALNEALTDPDSWVRYFAIRALGELQDKTSREILIELAQKDPAEHVRMAAQEVLELLKA